MNSVKKGFHCIRGSAIMAALELLWQNSGYGRAQYVD